MSNQLVGAMLNGSPESNMVLPLCDFSFQNHINFSNLSKHKILKISKNDFRKKTSSNASKISSIKDISVNESKDGFCILISSSGHLKAKCGEVPAFGSAFKKIYFDLLDSTICSSVKKNVKIKKEGFSDIKIGQFKKNTVRLVIEIAPSVVFSLEENSASLLTKIFFNDIFFQKANQNKLSTINPKISALDNFRVVIDAGHGGADNGAIGPTGLREKDVTLAIAKKIKSLLETKTKIKAYMTRDCDSTVELEERAKFANRIGANLFVSIHVNASRNSAARGIETYYLDIAHDNYAMRLASRENAMSETETSNLEYILADLNMKSNTRDSAVLGQIMQNSIVSSIGVKWKDVKNLGLKHAMFYVLLGAKMPSVLIETSFISNKKEEKRLRSSIYQETLAFGIVNGIKEFIGKTAL